MINTYCWDNDLNNFIKNNAFQNVSCFRNMWGQKIASPAPKIPNYVMIDLNNGLIRLKSTIPLL